MRGGDGTGLEAAAGVGDSGAGAAMATVPVGSLLPGHSREEARGVHETAFAAAKGGAFLISDMTAPIVSASAAVLDRGYDLIPIAAGAAHSGAVAYSLIKNRQGVQRCRQFQIDVDQLSLELKRVHRRLTVSVENLFAENRPGINILNAGEHERLIRLIRERFQLVGFDDVPDGSNVRDLLLAVDIPADIREFTQKHSGRWNWGLEAISSGLFWIASGIEYSYTDDDGTAEDANYYLRRYLVPVFKLGSVLLFAGTHILAAGELRREQARLQWHIDELQDYKKQLQRLAIIVSECEHAIVLHNAHDDRDRAAADVARDLAAERAARMALEEQAADLTRVRDSLAEDLSTAREQNETLSRKLTAMSGRVTVAEESVRNLVASLAAAEREKGVLERKADAQELRIRGLISESGTLKTQLADAKRHGAEERAKFAERLSAVTEQLAREKSRFSELTAQLAAAKEQVSELQAQLRTQQETQQALALA